MVLPKRLRRLGQGFEQLGVLRPGIGKQHAQPLRKLGVLVHGTALACGGRTLRGVALRSMMACERMVPLLPSNVAW